MVKRDRHIPLLLKLRVAQDSGGTHTCLLSTEVCPTHDATGQAARVTLTTST